MFDVRTRQMVNVFGDRPLQGLWNLFYEADSRRSVDREFTDELLNFVFSMPEDERAALE